MTYWITVYVADPGYDRDRFARDIIDILKKKKKPSNRQRIINFIKSLNKKRGK